MEMGCPECVCTSWSVGWVRDRLEGCETNSGAMGTQPGLSPLHRERQSISFPFMNRIAEGLVERVGCGGSKGRPRF